MLMHNKFAIMKLGSGNSVYPLKIFQRVITVSPETMKIMKALPPLGDLL